MINPDKVDLHILAMEKIEHDAHVTNRTVELLGRLPRAVKRGLAASICAQDCFARINPDQEAPDYDVQVTGALYNWPTYTITMEVSRNAKPLVIVSITRDKSAV